MAKYEFPSKDVSSGGAMKDAIVKAEIKKIEKVLKNDGIVAQTEAPTAATVEVVEPVIVPPKLKEIYGDEIPPKDVLETFAILKSPKTIKSYLEKVTAGKKMDEERKTGRKQERKRNRGKKLRQLADKTSEPVASQATEVPNDNAEVKPPQTPATISETDEDRSVNQANEPIIDFAFPDATPVAEPAPAAEAPKNDWKEALVASDVEVKPPQTPATISETEAVGGPEIEKTPAEIAEDKWSGLRRKLENAPADEGVKVILGPEDVRQKRVQFNLLKKNLSGQNKELGTRAKEYGMKFESFVRNTGERYRKLPLKYKIGVAGALLGLNVATGGASTLVTLLTSTAMLGQRALGATSAYALIDGLYEKRLARKEKERGSERTEFEKWKKRGYSTATALAVFTGLPGYAVKEGFDAIGGGGMLKALGALMGISPDTAELPHTIPKPAGTPAEPLVIDEIKQQIVEENARAATEASTPQESRQALRTAVEKLTRVSATADAKFEMPKHADFSIHEDDTEISPYDVTPTDQSGADDDIVQASEESQPVAETESAVEPAVQQAESVEETPRTWQEKIVPEDTSPAALDQADLTQDQIENPTPPAESTPAQVENTKEWTNPNGVKIDPLRGGVYQYPNGVPVAYGKDALDAAQDFAKANPNTSVWVQSEKPVLYEGKLHQYVYEVKYGFWRGMQILGADGPSDPSHIITIDPKALVKRLGE